MPPVLCVSAGNEGDRRIALKKRLKKGESFKTLLWPYLFQKTAESPETPTKYQDNFAIYSPDLTRLVVTPHLYNVDRGYREAGTFPQIGEGHGAYYITDEYFQMDESDQINDILAKWFHGFIGVGGMVDEEVNRYYAMVDIALQDSDLNFATTAGALTSSRYIPGFEIKIEMCIRDSYSVVFSSIIPEKIGHDRKAVAATLKSEVKDRVNNSATNVLRNRIDAYGVVSPNIQVLQDNDGQILLELPGVKEHQRVRELLLRSANLEFYECYGAGKLTPNIMQLDNCLLYTSPAPSSPW